MRSLELYYEKPHTNWFLSHYFNNVANKLINQHKDISFKVVNTGEYKNRDPNNISSPHILTIKNPDNEKYILISFWDKNAIIFNKTIWQPEKMVQALTSSGINPGELAFLKLYNPHCIIPDNIYDVLTPFTYYPYCLNTAATIEDLYATRQTLNNLENKIIFRGFMYNEREFLFNSFKNSDKFIFTNERIGYLEYLSEQINNLCTLSINGAGEICNRDIEFFGMGMPVLRTILNTQLHNELKPDVHYISLGPCEFRSSYTHINYESYKKILISTFNKVIEQKDFCLQVGANARKWYNENCTMDSMLCLTEKLLQLDRLFS